MGKGIDKETRGANIKKIVPNPELNKGLVLGTLTDVDLGTAEIRNDSSWVDFREKIVPRITFVFTEKAVAKDKEQGVYFKSYTAFPDIFNKDNEWQWDTMAQTLKHFIDVLSENDFKDEYADLLNLAIDEGKDYTVDQQIAAWETFMKGVTTVFKGDSKKGLPSLINKDVWMKLLLDVKGQKVNRGDYGFPGYPGDGVIELYKEGITPSLRINVSKGENITPRAYEAPTDLGSVSGNDKAAPSGGRPAFMQD